MVVHGDEGRIELPDPFAQSPSREAQIRIYGSGEIWEPDDAEVETLAKINQYVPQAEAFCAAVRGEAPPAFPLEDSIKMLRILDALARSGESGRWRRSAPEHRMLRAAHAAITGRIRPGRDGDMTTAPTEALKLYGTEQEAPAARTLRAGALSAELEAGKLRWIRNGGTEALRGIAFVVRGSGWETYAPEIANLEIEGGSRTLPRRLRRAHRIRRRRARLPRRHRGGERAEPGFHGRVSARNRVQDQPHGLRRAARDRGRRGGSLRHHPQRRLGGGDRIPRPDHAVAAFFDISAMRHQVSPGVWAHLPLRRRRPLGDRGSAQLDRCVLQDLLPPLALPYPYPLAAGETLRQTATLTIEGGSAAVATAAGGDDGAVEIALGGETGQHMPEIGLGVAASERDRLDHGLDLLRALGPGHLVCECDPRDDRSVETLAASRELAQASTPRSCWRSWCPASGRWRMSSPRQPRSRDAPGFRPPPSCPSRPGS